MHMEELGQSVTVIRRGD